MKNQYNSNFMYKTGYHFSLFRIITNKTLIFPPGKLIVE